MSDLKSLFYSLLIAGLAISLVACDAPDADADDEPAEAEAPAADESGDDESAAADDDSLPMVEVSDEGTEFDPPVEKEQIPEGAYICDMGTVHYARMEEGDGTCPLCNMALVPHGGAADEAHDDHDHDHDDDDHGHDHDDHDHAH